MVSAHGAGGRRVAYLADLVRELVMRDIRVRYKRSVLGIGWSLLNPLLQFVVFYAVFRWVVPVNVPDFAIFLLIGILAIGLAYAWRKRAMEWL